MEKKQRKVFTAFRTAAQNSPRARMVAFLRIRLRSRANAYGNRSFFCSQGYILTNTLYDGSPLGASLLEKKWGDGQWCRIAQRSSESEQGLARWMAFSSDEAELKAAVENIEKIACKRAAV